MRSQYSPSFVTSLKHSPKKKELGGAVHEDASDSKEVYELKRIDGPAVLAEMDVDLNESPAPTVMVESLSEPFSARHMHDKVATIIDGEWDALADQDSFSSA